MSTVTGAVARLTEKVVSNGSTSFGFQVNGEWYSTFDKQDAKEGDVVTFDFIQKGNYKNIAKGSIRASVGAAPSAPTAAPQAANSRDISIVYQSSRKDAIAIVTAMLSNDCIKLPAAENKRYGAVMGLVDELANMYYNEVQSVIENGGVKQEQEAPQPEDF